MKSIYSDQCWDVNGSNEVHVITGTFDISARDTFFTHISPC